MSSNSWFFICSDSSSTRLFSLPTHTHAHTHTRTHSQRQLLILPVHPRAPSPAVHPHKLAVLVSQRVQPVHFGLRLVTLHTATRHRMVITMVIALMIPQQPCAILTSSSAAARSSANDSELDCHRRDAHKHARHPVGPCDGSRLAAK